MKYRIAILGSNNMRIGYWRMFDSGAIRLFDSVSDAQRIMDTWQIHGIIEENK